MTGSAAIDTVIGLVFIYSLYSLLTTTVVEMLTSLIRLRSSFLERGIHRMLDDGSGTRVFAKAFFQQPVIKYLGSGNLFGLIKKPSYISAQNFSKALMEVLKDSGTESLSKQGTTAVDQVTPLMKIKAALTDPNNPFAKSETVHYLSTLLDDAQNDLDKFRTLAEQWFDDTMERVSSWYKKWVQVITLVIGFILAWTFNVDTIQIARKLSKDPQAREQLVAMSQTMIEHPELAKKITSDTTFTDIKASYDSLRQQAFDTNNVLALPRHDQATDHLAGWIITALALSLGAPFWFDMLNKLMKLRGSIQAGQQAAATGTQVDAAVSATVSKVNIDG